MFLFVDCVLGIVRLKNKKLVPWCQKPLVDNRTFYVWKSPIFKQTGHVDTDLLLFICLVGHSALMVLGVFIMVWLISSAIHYEQLSLSPL